MRKTIITMLVVMLTIAPAWASPATPDVVQGTATFVQDGSNWTITTGSSATIINWGQFGVDAGSTVNFIQPSSTSSVLNNVLGSQSSMINGLLTSNGIIYLINPNGITIGTSGMINAAGFFGSTLSVSNADFLAGGDMNFTGDSLAAIKNFGEINAIGGDIYLIARKIVNTGTINAASGSANLIAGSDILLTHDREIFIRANLAGDGEGIGIENSGSIEAITARLQANGNLYALAINNAGAVRATGTQIVDGRVLLKADGGAIINTGTLAATSEGNGGEIMVLASNVTIGSGAVLDAGNAGFIETSGTNSVVIEDVSVTAGIGGTWVIDPTNIDIDLASATAIAASLTAGTSVDVLTPAAGPQSGIITVSSPIDATATPAGTHLFFGAFDQILVNADINIGAGTLRFLALANGVTQAAGTTIVAGKMSLRGTGGFDLAQASNDFGMIAVDVTGDVAIADINDMAIGNVVFAHGLNANGGDVDIFTPNGFLTANGVLNDATRFVKGYHSIGDVKIVETTSGSNIYYIRMTNGILNPQKTQAQIETHLGMLANGLDAIDPLTTEGAALRLDVDPTRAGEIFGYTWDFKTVSKFAAVANIDYAFDVVSPFGSPSAPGFIADINDAAMVDPLPQWGWYTGYTSKSFTLNKTTPYVLGFGVMDVEDTVAQSGLFLSNIFYSSIDIAPESSIYFRIFDHVEDFAHLRPDDIVLPTVAGALKPALDSATTFFDNRLFDTNHTYFYQSVGSIYQIPR